MTSNDNDFAPQSVGLAQPEAHGRAALLLVESLIHGLCEDSTLTAGRAVEIAERAVDVEADHAEAADGAGAPMWRSHALLSVIAGSFRADTDKGPTPPRLVV